MTEQLQSPPWAIVRIQTDKGIRLGLAYPEDLEEDEKGAILAYPVPDAEGDTRVGAMAEELGIPGYDDGEEEFLGYAPEAPAN